MANIITKYYNKIYNWIRIKKFNVIIGKNSCFRGKIYFSGENIKMGNNCKINSGFKFNSIGGQERMIIVTRKEGKIIIGDNVGISNSSIVSINEVIIGNNVMIGGSCKIYDNDFHSLTLANRMAKTDPDIKNAPVHINDGAFIGAHSIILKGVTIGKNSVIGAGSVVTKDVPDNEIWAGNPAKFIKKVDMGK